MLRAIVGIVIAAIVLPFAVIAGLISRRGRNYTAQEMAAQLQRLAQGDMSGWDDLECGGPLRDARLEALRQEAMTVELPLRPQYRAKLADLSLQAIRTAVLSYVHADVVKIITSADGKAQIALLRRNDGLYEYRAYVERVDDAPYGARPYWAPTAYSGLYETVEELERAARLNVPWLREMS